MKKRLLAGLATGIFITFLSGQVQAITITGQQAITSTGQSFTFNTSGLAMNNGDGLFNITARGDYTVGFPTVENMLNWNIDNIATGSAWAPANADSYTVYAYDDVLWTKTVTIGATSLAQILNDGLMQVFMQNSGDVNNFYSTDFVSYSLTYSDAAPVPEPATMLLMGTGLAGLIGARRKKKA